MKGFGICPVQACIEHVRYVASPNFDERPSPLIDMIVVHCISLPPGQFGGPYIEDLFLNRLDKSKHTYFEQIAHLKVSSHLLIDRNGQVTQFVPFDKRAWHAGVSTYAGRPECNDYSIGIELEGSDTEAFTEAQYQSLIACSKVLMSHYSDITLDRIVGHSDIAPRRKTDPGPFFDWVKLRAGLEAKT